jgi:dihydrolipoamide dehydrogenase
MVLPGSDEDAAKVLQDVFVRKGIHIKSKARADKVVNTGKGVDVTLASGEVIHGSHCLMAVGSIPNTSDLGLEEAGILVTESGHHNLTREAFANLASAAGSG